ncbi:unnamed protein product [Rotaria sp. Silwood1]|nr:unnamed protein product [Rotaria sp. Silwood1]CAF5048668.1 unnamed protein product [Rotaria sp. Silwood1]
MNGVNMIDDDDDDDEVQIKTTSSTSISSKSSSLTTKKKKGVFPRCKACLKTFSVHCDGKSAVEKHMTSYVHKKSMKTFENNCSLTQFITPERELDKIAAAECVLVFHGVKHGHSYRSQECTADLIRNKI